MATGWPMKTTYANGDVFSSTDVNDITGTVNLAGGAQWAAAKNKIINGDFRFNQRAFTSNTTSGAYNFDRWLQGNVGGTVTTTPQTFTAGTAPVAGYEGVNFVQVAVTGQSAAGDFAQYLQKFEDVRTFAGQTVTVSFWAKASSGTPKLSVEMIQGFGSGGSGDVNTSASAATTLSTSWARYSTTIAIPSISGKTIGTGSWLQTTFWLSSGSTYASRANSIGIQTATFQIWGVQVESGSTATAFQTATGTISGELAACQRYFYRTTFNKYQCWARDSNLIFFNFRNPITMRVNPSVSTSLTSKIATGPTTSAQVMFYYGGSIAGTATLTLGTDSATTDAVTVYFSGATFTQGVIPTAEVAGGYFDVSAEL